MLALKHVPLFHVTDPGIYRLHLCISNGIYFSERKIQQAETYGLCPDTCRDRHIQHRNEGQKRCWYRLLYRAIIQSRHIGKVVELAIEEFEKLKDYECEFVLVNDYSRDHTWKSIHALTEKYPNVKRNQPG